MNQKSLFHRELQLSCFLEGSSRMQSQRGAGGESGGSNPDQDQQQQLPHSDNLHT